jgi:flagellar FliL protein
MAEKSEAPAQPATPSPAGGSKLPTIVAAVNTLLLAAVLAVQVLGMRAAAKGPPAAPPADAAAAAPGAHAEPGAPAPPAPEPAASPLPGPMLRVPDFVVHLRDTDADRYARVAFEIELQDDKAKDALNARLPQVRDAFLTHLSDRTVDELRGSEALARLKGALEGRVREVAPSAPIRAVYVTELVVQ